MRGVPYSGGKKKNHTDCAAALSVCLMMQRCRVAGTWPVFRDHHDIWMLAWRHLLTRPAGAVSFYKVKAHVNPDLLDDSVLRQHAKMNNIVDGVAKSCARKALRGRIRLLEKEELMLQHDFTLLGCFHEMWHEMSTRCWANVKSATERVSAMPHFQLPFVLQGSVVCHCDISDDECASCPFGEVFAQRVRSYFQGLRWHPDKPPTSALELYVDFALHTGTSVPIRVDSNGSRPNAKEEFALPDRDIRADAFQVPLVVQSRTWVRMMKWILNRWDDAPMVIQNRCKSLSSVGYTMPAFSVSGCPQLRMGAKVHEALWEFFHTNGRIHNSLGKQWHPPRSRAASSYAHAGA